MLRTRYSTLRVHITIGSMVSIPSSTCSRTSHFWKTSSKSTSKPKNIPTSNIKTDISEMQVENSPPPKKKIKDCFSMDQFHRIYWNQIWGSKIMSKISTLFIFQNMFDTWTQPSLQMSHRLLIIDSIDWRISSLQFYCYCNKIKWLTLNTINQSLSHSWSADQQLK